MADVTFTFKGDIADLKRALSDIKGEVSKTKESIGGVATKIATAFAAVAGAVVAAKGAIAAISGISSAAAEMEQTGLAMRVMLKDAELAASYMAKLRQYAAETPFEFGDISNAAKTLLSMGTEAGKSVEVLKKLGNIAAVSGKSLNELAFIYAKIQNNGLSNETAEQFATAGFDVRSMIAQLKGLTSADVFAGISKKLFDLSDVDAALDALTGEGGLLSGMVEQQAKTFAGTLSTLTDNVENLAVELGTPINAALLPVMNEIIAAVDALNPAVANVGVTIASAFSGAREIFGGINSALSPLIGSMGAVKVAIGAAAAGLLLYISRTQQATASNATFGTSFQALAARFQAFRAEMSSYSSLAGQFGALKRGFVSLATSAKSSMASLSASVKTSLAGIGATMRTTLIGIKVAWNATWASLAVAARAAMTAVKAALVSTGISLAIVAIGELLGALCSYFMKNKEAAEQTSDSWDRFFDRQKELKEMEKGVKTKDDKDAYMSALENQISELRKERRNAEREGYVELVRSLDTQIASIEKKKRAMDSILDKEIEYHTQVERANAALKAREAELKEIEARQEATRAKMEGLRKQQMEADQEAYFSGFEGEQQIQVRLKAIGFESIGALKYEIDRLTTWGTRDEEEAEKYEAMIAAYNKLVALRKEIDEGEKRSKEEAERKKKALEEQRAECDMRLKILEAEAAHDKERVAQLEAEQRLLKLTTEYRKAGFKDAEAMARREVAAELAAEQARKEDEKEPQGNRMPASWIQSSKAAVGGGGRSYLVGGDAMLSEQKKHTKSLDRLVALGEKPKPISVKVDSVIGK